MLEAMYCKNLHVFLIIWFSEICKSYNNWKYGINSSILDINSFLEEVLDNNLLIDRYMI